MDRDTPPTVSQIVIEFKGEDGMVPTIRSSALSPAQWAIAAQMVAVMSQSTWAQAMATAQARGIIAASAGALGSLNLADHLAKGGPRRG